jgi:membrane-associated phospholipid phosphatase
MLAGWAGMKELQNLPDLEPKGPLEEIDAEVADVLVPYAEQGAVRAIGAVSDLSDQEPLYAASAAVLATAAVLGDGRTWRAGTRLLASHLLATGLRGIIKQTVDRTRPDAAAERGEYVLREGQRQDSDFNSFPSGHTAGAVAFALALARDYPGSRALALGLASVAGAAQVIRSKHYISDVVAGAAIGWAGEALIAGLIRRAART